MDHPNLELLNQQPDLNETKVESEKRKNCEKIVIQNEACNKLRDYVSQYKTLWGKIVHTFDMPTWNHKLHKCDLIKNVDSFKLLKMKQQEKI